MRRFRLDRGLRPVAGASASRMLHVQADSFLPAVHARIFHEGHRRGIAVEKIVSRPAIRLSEAQQPVTERAKIEADQATSRALAG